MMPDTDDPEYDSPYGYQNPPLPEGNEMTQEYKTLRELDVKPWDVVECVGKVNESDPYNDLIGVQYFHDGKVMRRKCYWGDGFVNLNEPDLYFRIVSRAPCDDIPKLWRDMTDVEKGALLLAHHKGKAIEAWDGDEWLHADCPSWSYDTQYRVRPEPKRER